MPPGCRQQNVLPEMTSIAVFFDGPKFKAAGKDLFVDYREKVP
jgi:hypothetical protein